MNIILDAYFDKNFGDDIFIKVITNMFPKHKFYTFLEFYPQEVCNWASQISNLYLLPECKVFLSKNMFDAYICVGGDIFPDGGDFTKRKEIVQSVKQVNGIVVFMGFSLFHYYSKKTKHDLYELMKIANIIAPRDETSAKILRQILPGVEIQTMTDLAFSFQWKKQELNIKQRIGISVRRPNYADENSMNLYCDYLASVIKIYLRENEQRKVKLFSLSDGTSMDSKVVSTILERLKISDGSDRIEHIVYEGSITIIEDEIKQCDVMICTRLHAMIPCIAMEIPFIPIIYEVKMEHILEEIGYTGPMFLFDKMDGLDKWLEQLLKQDKLSVGKLWKANLKEQYLGKATNVLEKVHVLFKSPKWATAIHKLDETGPICDEKEYAKQQTAEVIKKNHELEVMAKEVQKKDNIVSECQKIIGQYLNTIEESNKINGEYFSLIEELRQQKDAKETENQELQMKMEAKETEYQELQMKMEAKETENQELQMKMEAKETENQEFKIKLEELLIKINNIEEILHNIKPYFMSKEGSVITKFLGKVISKKNSDIQNSWHNIINYFQEYKN